VEARNKPWLGGVPVDMRFPFRALLSMTACWIVANVALIAQETYFPKNALDDDSWGDQFKAAWYSQELRALEEPTLLDRATKPSFESYRFLWLRSFHHPLAVRLDIRTDGIGVLTTKVASGTGGFKPGHLVENTSRPLTRDQTLGFLTRLQEVGFWSLPSHVNDQTGADGSQWIIEGVKGGKYHIADRWSPNEGPVRELGINLAVGLAQMNIPKGELY
jgi:hypothetical protein